MDLPSGNAPVVTGNPRYDQLLALINANGYMRIDELASRLDVSTQTIRRDIKKLSDDGILSRYHGGAGQASSAINHDLKKREVSQTEEKQRIADVLAERIPDGSTIFLTAGTTIECVAKALDARQNLRIITSCLRVANLLYTRRDFDVMVPGGSLRYQNSGIIGSSAQDFLRGFRADYLIMSLGAIDPDGTMLEFDFNEVAVMKIMMANSRQIFVAADHTKFHASASVALGSTSEIDALFTDQAPPQPLASLLEQQMVEVVCADGAGSST
jgi:DeoR/GlpR family transcriptional regulator of sugar metabolism